MALDACVKNVLCTLAVPVLQSLDALIVALQAQLSIQLSAVAVAKLVLAVALAPVEGALELAQAVRDQFNVAYTLLPANLMNGCIDLGDIMQRVNDVTSIATGEIDDFITDANRLLSEQDALNALEIDLNLTTVKFTEFRDVIAECIAEAA